MTNIDEMPAGPEMNERIAVEIFNATRATPEQKIMIDQMASQFSSHLPIYQRFTDFMLIRKLAHTNSHTGADFEFIQAYDYSTRDYEAMKILAEFKQWEIKRNYESYIVTISPYHFPNGRALGVGKAETLALAICRAALNAAKNRKES